MKKKLLYVILALALALVFTAAFATVAGAADDEQFTLTPKDMKVGVGETYKISWQTNFVPDEYKLMIYSPSAAAWTHLATVPYTDGEVSYDVFSDTAKSNFYCIRAYKDGELVAESGQFIITWAEGYRVSYLPNGGTGTMESQFVNDGKTTMLSYCYFEAPEGYRFSHWEINGEAYSQFSDYTVKDHTVVIAQWLPTVTCLPLEIDGSAMGGKKSPEQASLKLPNAENIYYCQGDVCCGMTKKSDTWYDAETDQPADEFVDGKTYYYHLGIHPDFDHLLPNITEQEAENVAIISGIEWLYTSASTMGSDNSNYKCYTVDYYLTYDEQTGIKADNRTVIDPIIIDASSMAGAKSPVSLDLPSINNEIFSICDGNCGFCDDELGMIYNSWVDPQTYGPVNSFVNGRQYVFYIMLHLKDGYKIPDDIPDDFVTLEGVEWEEASIFGYLSSLAFMGGITYSEETGIPASAHVCHPTYTEATAPTCTEYGIMAHYECKCGKVYEDSTGAVEIPDLIAAYGIAPLGHSFSEPYKYDEDVHYKECVCGEDDDAAPHFDDDFDNECDACGYKSEGEDSIPVSPDHTHTYSPDWKTTENEHYKECACGQKQHAGEHTDANENGSCDICGKKLTEVKKPLGKGAVAGIIIGSATGTVAVSVGIFSLIWFVIKKKSFADLIAIFKKK